MTVLPEELPGAALVLRRWRLPMAGEMARAIERSALELQRWMPWARDDVSRAQLEHILIELEASFDNDTEWNYAIVETASEELVGSCGLQRVGDPLCPEIGYWIRSDRTGRGYATMSAGALARTAFQFLEDLERIKIRMDQANLASAAVPPKLGFTLDHEEDREIVTSGHTGRGFVWILRRGDWDSST